MYVLVSSSTDLVLLTRVFATREAAARALDTLKQSLTEESVAKYITIKEIDVEQ